MGKTNNPTPSNEETPVDTTNTSEETSNSSEDTVSPEEVVEASEVPTTDGEILGESVVEEVVETPAPPAPGSYMAATMGVQQDASGHFNSTKHVLSDKSGTRI